MLLRETFLTEITIKFDPFMNRPYVAFEAFPPAKTLRTEGTLKFFHSFMNCLDVVLQNL